MALEQLQDALEAYFNAHYHSSIVLSAAAEQLLAGYLLKHGIESAYTQDRSVIARMANALRSEADPEETSEKDIGNLMNRVYNHSKHADKSHHEVLMDAKEEARHVLDRAITNYDVLFSRVEYELPNLPLAQQFRMESIADVRAE